jgi:hypothetical protein
MKRQKGEERKKHQKKGCVCLTVLMRIKNIHYMAAGNILDVNSLEEEEFNVFMYASNDKIEF